MSLTSHLKDPTSPVRAYLRTRLLRTTPLITPVNAELRTLPCLRPPGEIAGYPWGTIGMAMDYRLRYAFTITPADQLVAYKGLLRYTGLQVADVDPTTGELLFLNTRTGELFSGDPTTDKLLDEARLPGATCAVAAAQDFFAGLDDTLARLQPVRRRLAPEAEQEMARLCYVLALFETAYRGGGKGAAYGPLFTLPEKRTVADLLAVVEPAWVEDLCHLHALFMEQHRDLLYKSFTLNPTFTGSGDVGGADADLIVGGCLVEIKTTIRDTVEPDWLYQLAGYTLLAWDGTPAPGIRAVGLYLTRHGLLVRWPVQEFFGVLTGDSTVTVAGLRQEFKAVVEALPEKQARDKRQRDYWQAVVEGRG